MTTQKTYLRKLRINLRKVPEGLFHLKLSEIGIKRKNSKPSKFLSQNRQQKRFWQDLIKLLCLALQMRRKKPLCLELWKRKKLKKVTILFVKEKKEIISTSQRVVLYLATSSSLAKQKRPSLNVINRVNPSENFLFYITLLVLQQLYLMVRLCFGAQTDRPLIILLKELPARKFRSMKISYQRLRFFKRWTTMKDQNLVMLLRKRHSNKASLLSKRAKKETHFTLLKRVKQLQQRLLKQEKKQKK